MFARTTRLTLRPWWPEDAAALADAIAHQDVALRLARMPWPYLADDAAAFVSRAGHVASPMLAILSHADDYPAIVGGIGLTVAEDGVHELGYWLTPAAWGRGYATEAGRAVLDAARHTLGIAHLRAWHHADNAASGAVLRKLGFREVGRSPRFSLARGGTVDSVEVALDLAEDQRPMPIAA